jgi:hydrogenase maturation protease
MSTESGPLTVIGIGNILLRDDGVGVHVVQELRDLVERGKATLPAGTRLVDGGTLGLGLLGEIDGARAVVFVDAADLGRAPGAVATIRGDALRRAPAGSGRSRSGVSGLLAAAEMAGVLPRAVALIGIQPLAIDAGLEPTDLIAGTVTAAVEATLSELHRLEAVTQPHRPTTTPAQHLTGARA